MLSVILAIIEFTAMVKTKNFEIGAFVKPEANMVKVVFYALGVIL